MVDVLVVDDESPIRSLVAMVLRGAGLVVRTASNGAEALRLVEEQMPSAIVLDRMMPVMTGDEFLLVARERGWQIPTILLSAYLENPLPTSVKPSRSMAKPFDPHQLLALVRELLDEPRPTLP